MKKGCKIRYQVVKYNENHGLAYPVDNRYLRRKNAQAALTWYASNDFENYAMYGLSKVVFYPAYVPKFYEYIED